MRTSCSQFRSRKFRAALRRHGLIGSMGRVATAADNAAMGSWFSLLQNVLNRPRTWATRDDLRFAIVWWTVHTDNTRRRQRALGKRTLVADELMLTGTPLVGAA